MPVFINEIFRFISWKEVLLSFPMFWLFHWFVFADVFWQRLVQIVAGLEATDPIYRVEPAPRMTGDGNTQYTDHNQMVADFWQGFRVNCR